jgi:hypothetical protein
VKLTAEADTRASVERKIVPSPARILLPPLRPEGVRVRPVQVVPPVHGVHAVGHNRALLYVHRSGPVRSAANGERGVLSGNAEVDWHRRHQAEDCVC